MAQKHDPAIYKGIKKIISKVPCCLFSFMYILEWQDSRAGEQSSGCQGLEAEEGRQ